MTYRLVVALLLAGLQSPPAKAGEPSRDLSSYTLFAVEGLRARGLHVAGGNIGINRGRLVAAGMLMAPNSEVAADSARLGPASRCVQLYTNRLTRTGEGCPGITPLSLPLVDDVAGGCGFPAPFPACDPAAAVSVARGETTALPAGTHGAVRIARSATLKLGGGDYVLCGLQMARGSRLVFEAPTRVSVAGNVILGPGAAAGPDAGLTSGDIQLFVSGDRVRFGNRTEVQGSVCAPGSVVTLEDGATFEGRAVARVLRTGQARVWPLAAPSPPPSTTTSTSPAPLPPPTTTTTLPPPPGCGNGVKDEGEQCDGQDFGGSTCPAGQALLGCNGRCRLDYRNCPCDGVIGQSTLDVIQTRIFNVRGCTLSGCHGAFPQVGLNLTGATEGSTHMNLVNVPASNAVANAAGKKRVVPGDASASFLTQKLRGDLAAGEGARMPLSGRILNALELELLDLWIDAGAPACGQVEGAPSLPVERYEPTTPPPVPAGGYQIVLEGPTLQPGQEQEICLWIPVPNDTDFTVGRWEMALNPGTHHFAVVPWSRTYPPPLGRWSTSDPGCVSGFDDPADFGVNITGSPQAPHFVDQYPPGVARVLRAGSYIGLNAHYANVYDVPLEIKVWTNAYPYEGTPAHLAVSLVTLDSTFTINVPPNTQKIHRGHFVNNFGGPMALFNVSGHMHKRGLRFTAWRSDGSLLYDNLDWSHPITRILDPPLVLAPGDYIDYACLQDNGVTREVRRDFSGRPAPLTFGITTEDEMCILTGSYYLD